MVSLNVSVPLQWDQKNRQDREVTARLALAERLRALGYFTAALTEDGWLEARFGFDQGFSILVTCETQEEIDRLWYALSEGGEQQAEQRHRSCLQEGPAGRAVVPGEPGLDALDGELVAGQLDEFDVRGVPPVTGKT